jgi:hypothetical protein
MKIWITLAFLAVAGSALAKSEVPSEKPKAIIEATTGSSEKFLMTCANGYSNAGGPGGITRTNTFCCEGCDYQTAKDIADRQCDEAVERAIISPVASDN